MPKQSQTEIFKMLMEEQEKREAALLEQIARAHLDLIRVKRNIAFFERHTPRSTVQR